MDISKITPGQRQISASDYNQMAERVRQIDNMTICGGSLTNLFGTPQLQISEQPQEWIWAHVKSVLTITPSAGPPATDLVQYEWTEATRVYNAYGHQEWNDVKDMSPKRPYSGSFSHSSAPGGYVNRLICANNAVRLQVGDYVLAHPGVLKFLTDDGYPDQEYVTASSTPGFWAVIDDLDTSTGVKYAWTALSVDPATGITSPDSTLGTAALADPNIAYEVSGAQFVLKKSKVWLTPVAGQPFYEFSYRGGVYPGTLTADITSSGGDVVLTCDDGSTTQTVTVYSALGTAHYSSSVSAQNAIMVAFGQSARWWIIAQACGS